MGDGAKSAALFLFSAAKSADSAAEFFGSAAVFLPLPHTDPKMYNHSFRRHGNFRAGRVGKLLCDWDVLGGMAAIPNGIPGGVRLHRWRRAAVFRQVDAGGAAHRW